MAISVVVLAVVAVVLFAFAAASEAFNGFLLVKSNPPRLMVVPRTYGSDASVSLHKRALSKARTDAHCVMSREASPPEDS